MGVPSHDDHRSTLSQSNYRARTGSNSIQMELFSGDWIAKFFVNTSRQMLLNAISHLYGPSHAQTRTGIAQICNACSSSVQARRARESLDTLREMNFWALGGLYRVCVGAVLRGVGSKHPQLACTTIAQGTCDDGPMHAPSSRMGSRCETHATQSHGGVRGSSKNCVIRALTHQSGPDALHVLPEKNRTRRRSTQRTQMRSH